MPFYRLLFELHVIDFVKNMGRPTPLAYFCIYINLVKLYIFQVPDIKFSVLKWYREYTNINIFNIRILNINKNLQNLSPL